MTQERIRTPIYEASNASRYERHSLIEQYEKLYDCNLAVVVGFIHALTPALVEELLCHINRKAREIHLLLDSPGGDGEAAIRTLRALRCRGEKLTVIVPNQAKSAATLLALGADEIIMVPIAPQWD